MTFWKSQNYRDGKQIGGCQKLEAGEKNRLHKRQHEESFCGVRTVMYNDCRGSNTTLSFCQNLQNYTTQRENFTVNFKINVKFSI